MVDVAAASAKTAEHPQDPSAESHSSGSTTSTSSSGCPSSDDDLERVACQPPPFLQQVSVGETLPLVGPMEITRLTATPHLFLLRNLLLRSEDRQALRDRATEIGLQNAATKFGPSAHRSKSQVAWIPHPMTEQQPSAPVAPGDVNVGVYDDNNDDIAATATAFLSQFTTQTFLHPDLWKSDIFRSEPLQIAQYQVGGRFDVHHDGGGRVVTILTYLNGVAGTWFPFAQLRASMATNTTKNKEGKDDDDNDDELPPPPPKMILRNEMMDRLQPGQDGIWIVGEEEDEETTRPTTDDRMTEDNCHVAKVQAGDAIVFYNYEYDEEQEGSIRAWRSLHVGMPARQEKWIATNWIESEFLNY